MSETTPDTKLLATYEGLRLKEHKLIHELLDIFPKIDKLGEERIGQVRDALFHADHPFLMVFVGPFSSGKSSLINALLGEDQFLKIGPTPTTDRIQILRHGQAPQRMDSGSDVDTVFYPSPLLEKVSFVDTPGLESVFQRHEETTRRFLHRSDVVLLVMLATQAMTASNLEYLQRLKQYGKKIIIVINQADLLTPEERSTVRDYVLAQSQDKLGFKPEVWLVSAKLGLEARKNGQLDAARWQESGLAQIEQYIDQQLGDAERLRQKLLTPLQIVQNAHQAALNVVKANQATLDHYQSIFENINQQVNAQKRELDKIIRETNHDVEAKFAESGARGGAAIREIFRFSGALGSLWRGLIFSIASIFRQGKRISYVKSAFDKHRVFEPIAELPSVVDKLGPRLEGTDMRDIDSLVQYGKKEVAALPKEIQDKVIGSIQAPLRYDRIALQNVRPALDKIEEEARKVETDGMEAIVRTTLFYLLLWEGLVVVLLVALVGAWDVVATSNETLPFVLLVFILALGLLGFLALPVRGRFLAANYANRLFKLQARYSEALTEAADKQVEYGMQLRRDAIAPLTRLIEAQTQIHNEQLARLQSAETTITQIESELAALGKRKWFGLRG